VKNKRLWILCGGIVLINATFLLIDFHIATGNTRAEKLIFTMDLGNNMPVPMQRRDNISVVLVGKGPLVSALGETLEEQLENAGLGKVEMVKELKPVYQNPVLVVKVGNPGTIWTPFFANSHFSVHAGYASDGDSTFMEIVEKTHTSTAKKDVANIYAEFEVSDNSYGLISRTGYHQFLADYLTQEIVQALKNLYNIQGSTSENLLVSVQQF